MSNKIIVGALLLAVASAAAVAQVPGPTPALAQAPSVSAPSASTPAAASATLGDSTVSPKEQALQRLRSRMDEQKVQDKPKDVSAPQPLAALPSSLSGGVSAVEDESIRVVAIYGLGSKLSAELKYKGWTQVFRSNGANPQIGPWSVERITPYEVTLVQSGKKSKNKKEGVTDAVRKVIYFSADMPPEQGAKSGSTIPGMPSMNGMPSMGGFPSMGGMLPTGAGPSTSASSSPFSGASGRMPPLPVPPMASSK